MKKAAIGAFLMLLLGVSCLNHRTVTPKENTPVNEVGEYHLLFTGWAKDTSWKVELTDSAIIVFMEKDQEKLVFSNIKRHAIMDVAGIGYHATDVHGHQISLEVFKEECIVAQGKKHSFRCDVSFTMENLENEKEINISGCGDYLGDERLNSNWQILKFKGSPISIIDSNRVPLIEFNTINAQINANMGCNGIGGIYILMENSMYFSPNFMSTQMYCEGAMQLEQDFTEAVSGKTLKYFFRNDQLILKSMDGDEILILKQN